MSNGTKTVPLTIQASIDPHTEPAMVIGSDSVSFGGKVSGYGGYWIVVADRRSLDVVFNEYVTTYDQAPDIGAYDTPDYMLLVATAQLGTGVVPQGAFYDFLYDNGAGAQLKRIVQVNQTLGCGSLVTVAYTLAGVLGPGRPDTPGVEVSSVTEAEYVLVMTASLVGVDVDGTTYYTPSPLSN